MPGDLHSAQEPLQPTTLSVLQRGHLGSLEGMPHDGQVGRTVIYASTSRNRASKPPARNAMPSEPANTPAK